MNNMIQHSDCMVLPSATHPQMDPIKKNMLKQDVLLFLTSLSNVPGYNSPRSHPQMFKGQRLVLNPDGWYVPMIPDVSWQNPFFCHKPKHQELL